MSGTEAGRAAIAEEFVTLVERAMDQMDFIQPLKDMIKRTKEHDAKVDDKLIRLEEDIVGLGKLIERHEKDLCQDHDRIKRLEDEVKELRQCLKSGDLPKDVVKKESSNDPCLDVGDIYVLKNSEVRSVWVVCLGRDGNMAIKMVPENKYYRPRDIIWTNLEYVAHITLGDLSI